MGIYTGAKSEGVVLDVLENAKKVLSQKSYACA
jgi:hypothetical protein